MSSYWSELNSDNYNKMPNQVETRNKIAKCIRRVGSLAVTNKAFYMDEKSFNPDLVKVVLKYASPKMVKLFDQIAKLDKHDARYHHKTYKHVIFTDIDNSNYGAKWIASAFAAHDFIPAFKNDLTLKSDEQLAAADGNAFGLLMSRPYGKKAFPTKFKKALLEKFNERPANAQGEKIRFIILDQGYKEGIDLYDVKYVHIFEPLQSISDQKQVIGRGTRYCGQKGLQFHPRYGWPLYVFRYDHALNVPLSVKVPVSSTLSELHMKFSNVDKRLMTFTEELEQVTIQASVDEPLTENLHTFSISQAPGALLNVMEGGAAKTIPVPPKSIVGLDAMRKLIKDKYHSFTYPHIKLENKCVDANTTNAVERLTFSPTQDFVRHFFQPTSAYKGLLLFHSVGVGKTCTAIATASTSFEREGYTILWVTRHTLKSDVWKNMLVPGQVCNTVLQDKIDAGAVKLPKKIPASKKVYISSNWLEPISYKQFSNLLLKKNKIYEEMVKRNGEKDPLHKTLVIIDEAHKLYAPNVTGSEKPNTDILENMIQNSYKTSGKDSVRLLLMTATPFVEDGTEMLKLLNLMRPAKEAFPTHFKTFAKEYLNSDGSFTTAGKKRYQNAVSGYVSYVNRSRDARSFAYANIEDIQVDISKIAEAINRGHHDNEIKRITEALKELAVHVKKEATDVSETVRDIKAKCAEEKSKAGSSCRTAAKSNYTQGMLVAKETKASNMESCKELPVKQRTPCKDNAKATYTDQVHEVRDRKEKDLEDCKARVKNAVLKRDKDIAEASAKLHELRGTASNMRSERKEHHAVLKEFRTENKGIRVDLKALRLKQKELKKQAQPLLIAQKKAKAAKDKAQLGELRDQLKKIKEQMKLLTDEKAKLVSRQVVAKMAVGRMKMVRFTQENSLNKCLSITEEEEEEDV